MNTQNLDNIIEAIRALHAAQSPEINILRRNESSALQTAEILLQKVVEMLSHWEQSPEIQRAIVFIEQGAGLQISERIESLALQISRL